MKPKGYIYKITNILNGKVYIGQTIKTIEERFRQHIYKAGCTHLHAAIKKWGKENFKIEIIEEVPKELLDEREIYWISYYNSTDNKIGYNIIKGGKLGRKEIYKLSEKEIQELVQMFKEGIGFNDLEKHFNMSRRSLRMILKREGAWIKRYKNLNEREDIEEIKKYLIENNPKAKDVCTKFKIGNMTLFRIAKSINYHFKTAPKRRKLGI
jgi:group I intron endonuclease